MTAADVVGAFDLAFSSDSVHWVDDVGRMAPLEIDQWTSEPDATDRQLFLSACDAATLDIGCGPGRLVADLTSRSIPAMGIDVSTEAVRQTRNRGALALRRDVFAQVPGEGRWQYALLADGNLGIGGDPVRLLRRIADLITPNGRIIAEVADHGVGLLRERRQLRIEGRLSAHFDWAEVGLDAIGDVAQAAGLAEIGRKTCGGRHAVTLGHRS